MLEKMGEFFDSRIDGYEEHQLRCIEFAREFYPYTAKCLPQAANCNILDLGCGTGLELEEYFKLNPTAHITGIDLAERMLTFMREKYADKNIEIVCASYFDIPFGEEIYDGAVSVESLHHYTKDEKIPLYKKLYKALKKGGVFILTDYFALSGEEERHHREELLRIKRAAGIMDNEFYHYDTPLTVEHETEALAEAGFSKIELLNSWGATHTLKAIK